MVKLFKAFMAIALVACAMPASAQFTGGGGKVSKSTTLAAGDTNPYNRISLSYDNTHLSGNDKMDDYFNGEDAISLNGVGLEYIHGFSVSKTLPMFVETGIKFQFGSGSVSDYDKSNEVDYIYKLQQLSFSVPVNYTYKFTVGEGISIAPYLGINFKIHGMGRTKYSVKFDDDDLQEDFEDYVDGNDEFEEMLKWKSVFDKKDMGSKDSTWNRFQMGWQIGAGLNVKAFYLGLQYGTDFISAYKYKKYAINSGNFTVKIGCNF